MRRPFKEEGEQTDGGQGEDGRTEGRTARGPTHHVAWLVRGRRANTPVLRSGATTMWPLARTASIVSASAARLAATRAGCAFYPFVTSRRLHPHASCRREEVERLELLKQQQQKVANFEAVKAAVAASSAGSDADALARAAAEPLAESLDKEKGASVTDVAVFDAHARRFEASWMEDMEALNVRAPDALTRVTEYVPEIVAFIERIVERGLAYESNGSVYMDLAAFKRAGHDYPKLQPSKGKATEAEMEESEGSHKAAAGEKRSAGDFALWKASKAGEPAWESPWGGGRPGWHIECSVMASELLGDNMDVHAGGVDLQFPHHDNELCQAEAFHGCGQWVNYFFHFGHLHIKGLKMAKSLKNFITIRQALGGLGKHGARRIRIMFLLQPWDKPIDYSDHTLDDAKNKEKTFINYFAEARAPPPAPPIVCATLPTAAAYTGSGRASYQR